MINKIKLEITIDNLNIVSHDDANLYAENIKYLLSEYHPAGLSNVPDNAVIVKIICVFKRYHLAFVI